MPCHIRDLHVDTTNLTDKCRALNQRWEENPRLNNDGVINPHRVENSKLMFCGS